MSGTCIDNRQLFQLSIAIVINSAHLYLGKELFAGTGAAVRVLGVCQTPGDGFDSTNQGFDQGSAITNAVVGRLGLGEAKLCLLFS